MNEKRVLVAYASKGGSTTGIAEAIGEELRGMGLQADVRAVTEVRDVQPYGAVVLGSAVYMFRWRPEAVRFGKRHAGELRGRPVWLFSSGPLDRSAEDKDIPAVKGAARLAARIGSRGHVTFGGRLAEDAEGFFAQKMVRGGKVEVGDFRNFDQIRAWAHGIGTEILRAASAA